MPSAPPSIPRRPFRFRGSSTGLLLALLAVLLLAGVAACGAGESDRGRAGEDIVMPVPEGTGEYTGGSRQELGQVEVEVRLFDRTIEMPASLPEGRTTFVVTNTGDATHSFEVEGRGLEAELERPLQPGETGTLTVELTPGDYTVYCPVGNHQAEGMERRLEITR